MEQRLLFLVALSMLGALLFAPVALAQATSTATASPCPSGIIIVETGECVTSPTPTAGPKGAAEQYHTATPGSAPKSAAAVQYQYGTPTATLPATGGGPTGVLALNALGAGALLVAGGFVARKLVR